MGNLAIDADAHPARAQLQLRVTMTAVAALPSTFPPARRAHADGDVRILWMGPDRWLLVSDERGADALARYCARVLEGALHHVADNTAAMACARLQGARVRDLLAMGSGIDWHGAEVMPGYCARTRFARLPAIVHALEPRSFELYYDRSHCDYLRRWFAHAAGDPLLAAS